MSRFNESNHESSQNLQIWYCEHCQAVHFKTVNVMLNFSKTEFAELTRTVLEIYSQEVGALEIHKLLNSPNHDDEVLLSEMIA